MKGESGLKASVGDGNTGTGGNGDLGAGEGKGGRPMMDRRRGLGGSPPPIGGRGGFELNGVLCSMEEPGLDLSSRDPPEFWRDTEGMCEVGGGIRGDLGVSDIPAAASAPSRISVGKGESDNSGCAWFTAWF